MKIERTIPEQEKSLSVWDMTLAVIATRNPENCFAGRRGAVPYRFSGRRLLCVRLNIKKAKKLNKQRKKITFSYLQLKKYVIECQL